VSHLGIRDGKGLMRAAGGGVEVVASRRGVCVRAGAGADGARSARRRAHAGGALPPAFSPASMPPEDERRPCERACGLGRARWRDEGGGVRGRQLTGAGRAGGEPGGEG
jgi:hypothetical protein